MDQKYEFHYMTNFVKEFGPFFRMPYCLFEGNNGYDPCFDNLSAIEKLLYGMLLNRANLIAKGNDLDNVNSLGGKDEKGRIYVTWGLGNIAKQLGCTSRAVWSYMKNLKDHGLIDNVYQNRGVLSHIYVRSIFTAQTNVNEPNDTDDSSGKNPDNGEEKPDTKTPDYGKNFNSNDYTNPNYRKNFNSSENDTNHPIEDDFQNTSDDDSNYGNNFNSNEDANPDYGKNFNSDESIDSNYGKNFNSGENDDVQDYGNKFHSNDDDDSDYGKNFHSGMENNSTVQMKNFPQSPHTYKRKENNQKNQSIDRSDMIETDEQTDTEDFNILSQYQELKAEVRNNLSYDSIIKDENCNYRDLLISLCNVITDKIWEAMSSTDGKVKMGRAEFPSGAVIDRFLELRRAHLENVIEAAEGRVDSNPLAYYLISLYNAPISASFQTSKTAKKTNLVTIAASKRNKRKKTNGIT